MNIHSFISSINHPGPSVTNVQKKFPALNYENEVFHKTELLFHLKLLTKDDECVKITYPSITRYPVTLGIDEQEINQGTFIHNGKLYGLHHKVSASDICNIGFKNFGKYIADENSFVTSVREYRLTDFKGKLCSNLYTSFESVCLSSEKMFEIIERDC